MPANKARDPRSRKRRYASAMVSIRILALLLAVMTLDDSASIAQTRPQQQDTPPPSPDCLIKGNVSVTTGEKIYHPPGCHFYRKSKIDPARGERWFCSEAEARAAGWRRTKVC